MKYDSDFLTSQIIAYLGNKRRLLPLLHSALSGIYGDALPEGLVFFDAFAGSGVVSRFAKFLGFEVLANDWEPYSYVVNRGYVAAGREDLPRLFGSDRGFVEVLDHLNNLSPPREEERYIARHYAPASDDPDAADYRRERLFYTRQNALRIDAIRNEIDRLFPAAAPDASGGGPGAAAGGPGGAFSFEAGPVETGPVEAREILTALLLYQAATHTNTSGVFKACHKGFGGHGKDALKRILSPVRLEIPPLIDSSRSCRIFQQDTNRLVRSTDFPSVDVAYLDPPYNQHQYGSNYHLLNTIALWDKPPVSGERDSSGRLKEKAGIRKDWARTKSAYCTRGKAEEAFLDLLSRLRAETVLVSYSTDGIIPFETLKGMCETRGKLGIVTNEYTKYRGGRQSNTRKTANVEFVLVVGRPESPGKSYSVDAVLKLRKVLLLFRDKYSKKKLGERFLLSDDGTVTADLGGRRISFPSRRYFELVPPENLADLSSGELGLLESRLLECRCGTKAEEMEEIYTNLGNGGGERDSFLSFIPGIMRKLAHKKYRSVYFHWIEKVRKLEAERPSATKTFRRELEKVEVLALRRFEN